ncbi:MAG: YkvA family protein [Gammaproteobacteria bacterium]|jgi:uncharacterized membrane protein YkvA (DUF1232 family)|nr:hypothetical protein [Gammaproteobacteria bacterium]MDP6096679.1 YkvA family protein [Gammaproteobacteria bacterium]MDP7455114.1 YkvA family protein [Gammaproteobacteria bacterium]HJO12052.1 YkvA family protein [Gammaproteobacteria bacterium]|tara:strand:+ start:1230 stop:1799 length:570 start_codon:yes stop_codon:yes gene_type:complete
MPLDITFRLSDEDLERFQDIADKAREKQLSSKTTVEIEELASRVLAAARATNLPSFINDRLVQLQKLLEMVEDEEWQLTEDERGNILGALAYFCEPVDLIPDDIPGIGFLDDALYVEIVIRELRDEIDLYNEFCEYRVSEEDRLKITGVDPYEGREEWLAEKRDILHNIMRERRSMRSGGRGWRMRLFF